MQIMLGPAAQRAGARLATPRPPYRASTLCKRQAETSTAVAEVIRKMGISEQTFYRWKKQYAGMGVAELQRMKQLEEENPSHSRPSTCIAYTIANGRGSLSVVAAQHGGSWLVIFVDPKAPLSVPDTVFLTSSLQSHC